MLNYLNKELRDQGIKPIEWTCKSNILNFIYYIFNK
jgi:hypothetical protein